ncbi:6386_t:CDS:2 [Funneliformis mosseae]|uniref:Peptide hydrolase n=1 Tax=Funneliformis mosseae TaxID=27381 RepID=A0A9N9HUH1_FUNMO|nr:6386_t:CDS:2 [Funneliformis mosseae]
MTEIESQQLIEDYLTPILLPRVSGSEGNLKVQKYIIEKFQSLGWNVEEDKFTDSTPIGEITFNNIIVTKDIKAPRKLVLAAHYDSKYFEPPNDGFIGATDSAVSCAMLMDLAFRLDPYFDNRDPESISTTLQIIFLDGEEAFKSWTATDSLYGSRHLAAKWENEYVVETDGSQNKAKNVLSSIEVFVLLDLLGYKEPLISNFFTTTSWLFIELSKIEARLFKSKLLKTSHDMHGMHGMQDPKETKLEDISYFDTDSIYTYQAHIEDDYIPFLQRGVPVLHVIPWPFPECWHKPSDNATAVDEAAFFNLNTIFRIFTAEYLNIDPNLPTIPPKN